MERLLWCGTVRAHGYADRLAAAAACAYDAVSIAPTDVRDARASGLTDADLLALQEVHGVTVPHLDPFTRWVPDWRPRPTGWAGDEGMTDFLGVDGDEFFAIAEALRCTSMSAIAVFGQGANTHDDLVAGFARCCDRAAELGMRVDLEPIPFWGVPTLAVAWDIVSAAGRENSGVMLDTWHFFRGDPDLDLLARIPGERITGVQVADAGPISPGRLPIEDCLEHRVTPGEGTLDNVTLLSLLHRTGGLSRVGPEVFSTGYDTTDATAAAVEATKGMDALLAAALPTADGGTSS